MKKIVSLLLTLCLLLTCASALAAGKLEITQETYVPMEAYGSFYGYIFAEVQNTGDKPIEYGSGVLEILSESGDSTDSADVYTMYPVVLGPGEMGYIYYMDVTEATAMDQIADHTLNAIGKSTKEEPVARVDGVAVYETMKTTYSSRQVVRATITNNSDATVYDFQTIIAVYDDEDHLLYVGTDSNYNLGLPAGQSLDVIFDIDDTFVQKWEADGVKVASVVAYAYPDR